jgi:Fur family ferric uptake transcriptional regulator
MNEVQTSRPNLMAVLEDRGYRSTAPRQAIVNLLERKQSGFTVEEISEDLPSVGRATVYRTIKLLLGEGVICKLALMDGAPKYSLSRNEHHHHTVCVKCGEVGEFRAATVERLLRAIGGDIQGQVVGHRMEFYINCYQCLAADKSS